MLEWNVYLSDINRKKIIIYNVFQHYNFCKDLKEEINNHNNKNEFSKRLKRICCYYFRAKCEYEIVLECFPEWDKFKKEKIDVCLQLELNWDKFVNYIWENKKEI